MKNAIPHLVAAAIFLAITIFYSLPAFQGKTIVQSDNVQASGMAKEITEYYDETGKATLWTNSMFSGMPGFQIWVAYPTDVMTGFHRFLKRWIPDPANKIFLFLIMSYLFLIVLGFEVPLAIVGAIALSFPSYNFIFIETGHSTKAMAIGYMFGVLAGIILTYRGKWLWGGLITAFFMTLELKSNHFQISYYLMMMGLGLFVVYLVQAIREKTMQQFVRASLIIGAATVIGVGNNTAHLWSTYSYSKHTIRGGKSELTTNKSENTGGLDKGYALDWSYGKMETMTLLVPNFAGGSSGESVIVNKDGSLKRESTTLRELQKIQDPNAANQIAGQVTNYWGPMRFTSGPAYMGAIICFLFIFGLAIVRGPLKGWVIAITVLSILLAWGRHLEWFTDIFFYYFPLYNKFRAVSTTLVMTQVAMPLMAILAIQQMLSGQIEKERLMMGLKYAAGITGGLCLLVFMMPSLFGDFTKVYTGLDGSIKYDESIVFAQYRGVHSALIQERMDLAGADALRSLVFIALAAGIVWYYINKGMQARVVIIALGSLIMIDMWGVNKRYLNEASFQEVTTQDQVVKPNRADLQIQQDKSLHYRTFNRSTDSFNDALTSYYHKSVGGYHAAKLRRYQELIEHHLLRENRVVYDMLNTKYFIIRSPEDGQPVARSNPGVLGNAWFVQEVRTVTNADEEIEALNGLEPGTQAVIDQRFSKHLEGFTPTADGSATIELTDYKPDELTYRSTTSSEQLAVFSEIYYPDGWEVTINGQEADHFRVNYVLRAMRIPAGENTIVFKFRPQSYYAGIKIGWVFQIILLGGIAFALWMQFKKKDEQEG